MFHLILRRRRITRSNTSNTRRSVSFDINTRRGVSSGIQILTSNTSNTRGSFSSDIQTLISNISNTRRRVSFDIQTPRNNRRRISNYRYVILYIDFLKVVRLVFWSGVVGSRFALARSRSALVRSRFALTVALRAQKLDLWASLYCILNARRSDYISVISTHWEVI